MNQVITVADGFNGSTVQLDAVDVLDFDKTAVKLHVYGKPWLIRWVCLDEYYRAVNEI